METQTVVSAVISLLSAIAAAYFGWRARRADSETKKVDIETTKQIALLGGEHEFRKTLLELIDQQDEKIEHQEERIERLQVQTEERNTLIDELKRANWTLSVENQHLKRRMTEYESEIVSLTKKLEQFKKEVRGE